MKRKLIESVVILPENLEYIGKCGKINGTLLVEIERIMEEYAAIKVREAQAKCTIPVVSGSLPLEKWEDVLKFHPWATKDHVIGYVSQNFDCVRKRQ
jgi:hypothetical protein